MVIKSENKTVLNMVSRIQNRNTGYSENLFSHNPRVDQNTLNSIDGATALKLDESYEIENEQENTLIIKKAIIQVMKILLELHQRKMKSSNNIPSGVSIESASYMENNNLGNQESVLILSESENNEEEYTPKLFSEDQNYQSEDIFDT